MKIGLFFGSFNPIHIGHLIIANHFVEFTDIQKVWFVVSPHNPLKNRQSLLDAGTRLKMVKAAIKGNNNFSASNVEFNLPQPSYTIDTLRLLSKKYKKNEFIILMGSDSFASLIHWKEYQLILSDYTIYVYRRRGSPVKLNNLIKNNILLFNFPYLDISATYIRELIENGKSVSYLVPENCINYLYK